jgi:hypothetical protein
MIPFGANDPVDPEPPPSRRRAIVIGAVLALVLWGSAVAVLLSRLSDEPNAPVGSMFAQSWTTETDDPVTLVKAVANPAADTAFDFSAEIDATNKSSYVAVRCDSGTLTVAFGKTEVRSKCRGGEVVGIFGYTKALSTYRAHVTVSRPQQANWGIAIYVGPRRS